MEIEQKEFLCMKKWVDMTYFIMYQLGAYYVAQLFTRENGLMAVPMRKYKTISGAERYLKGLKIDNPDGSGPELTYGTKHFIQEGKFWKN